MLKFMTGTALAVMFAVAPAMADTTGSAASSQTVPSATSEQKAVSQPADKAGGDSATTLNEGMKANDTSMTATGADGEPVSSVDKKAGEMGETTLEEGAPATTAGGEVIPAPDGDPASSDDS